MKETMRKKWKKAAALALLVCLVMNLCAPAVMAQDEAEEVSPEPVVQEVLPEEETPAEEPAAVEETPAEPVEEPAAAEETPAEPAEASVEEAAPAAVTLTAEQEGDWHVRMVCPAEAQIPEDARLSVQEIIGGAAYEAYLDTANAELKGDNQAVDAARFFDISILVGEDELQPAAPVTVEITFDEPVQQQEATVLHFEGEQDDALEATRVDSSTAADAVTFEAEGFSVYGVMFTVDFQYGDYFFSMAGETELLLSSC